MALDPIALTRLTPVCRLVNICAPLLGYVESAPRDPLNPASGLPRHTCSFNHTFTTIT